MNILVVFTGGTIGSSVSNGYISPNEVNKSKLINMYLERENSTQNFDVDTPYTVLSENLGGEHITKLVGCLDRHIKSNIYDGIIVTHGTDTLQYTAAALGIVFEDVEIPILLVSSNYPLEDSRANGYDNFKAAVEYIQNKGVSGVYAPYKNPGEKMEIFPANNMLSYDIYSDKIRKLSEIKAEETQGEDTTQALLYQKISVDTSTFRLSKMSPVRFITPYPGIQYDTPGPDTKAVIFRTYHSGTIQTGRTELIEFCNEMKSRGIQMYICGVPSGIGYESTKYYEELGIEVLPYGTDIYWYMKLWIICNCLEK